MNTEKIIDLTLDRATLRALYSPPKNTFCTVDVPELPFAVWDGEGAPEQPSIAAAIKGLYTAIYPIRREARDRGGKSFVEPPVEFLYWTDDTFDFSTHNRENCRWRAQITLPAWASSEHLRKSVATMSHQLTGMPSIHWETITEGQCVQFLHVGLMNGIPSILEELYERHLPELGLEPSGPYHEIYLDDWNRVVPEKRRVILRQPVCNQSK